MDMKKKKLDSLAFSFSSSSSSSSLRTKQSTTATGQPQCLQTPPSSSPQQTTIIRRLPILLPDYYYYYYSSSLMSFSSSPSKSHSNNNNNNNHHPAFIIFVAFLLLFSSSTSTIIIPAAAAAPSLHHPAPAVNQTFQAAKELQKINRINNYLSKINKPAVKTIQSPDGDLIDCVLTHLQPAFDHPQLRGQKPLEEAEAMMRRPNWKGVNNVSSGDEEEVKGMFQGWRDSGETCPEGTIPIRRTTERDILRSTSSIRRFGMKRVINRRRSVRRDSSGSGHEHAVVFVNGEQYYGAKASINVWAPRVTNQYEFSLSQLWLISGSFGNDLNTIEAGWQVSPELYGDNYPRFFTYWTTDAYQTTGCYNLLCSGFVQTNTKIAIGAAISPRSSYNGKQFDIGVMVWKDPKHGNWWLEFGSGVLIGYWPSFLFSHLRSHAEMVQFGGEIVNTRSSGYHTSTQMGSGHFAEEGFGKASYFRNLQVVDWDNNLLPLKNIHLLADHSNCYDIKQGQSSVWGTYFYYGGPGRNVRCP